MKREIDIDQLVTAMKAVDEAGRLFEEARAVYEARGLKRISDDFKVAGGSVQTLQGAEEMALGARKYLAELALIAGYAAAGLGERAGERPETARAGFPGISGGGARMARPLLDPTLEGLRLLLAVDFFEPAFKAAIEDVVHAEKATYPDPSTFRIPTRGDRAATAGRTP
ncbi:hypothetical protein [Streptomyces nojiriensis]|uniref:Uncharacterized protein n=1 Tax=Streptomyces nojiriensis TaxID=66374 RepID=A0ABQ3SNQ1_9ACTN|nr:hypothetical protein [Streptomyces nojiriensis]QTI43322.1 hypothetical protein JYK04_01084 [Streptomyces nojiriensis]GGS12097.1 hypothetical protein GCM10010205_47260 [Streptomyces nojiriensis]GHI69771.1 hypothetical protein Snoj_36890 [Streptomyces nojiriensis]